MNWLRRLLEALAFPPPRPPEPGPIPQYRPQVTVIHMTPDEYREMLWQRVFAEIQRRPGEPLH